MNGKYIRFKEFLINNIYNGVKFIIELKKYINYFLFKIKIDLIITTIFKDINQIIIY